MALTGWSSSNHLKKTSSKVYDTEPMMISAWIKVPDFTTDYYMLATSGVDGSTVNRRTLRTDITTGNVTAQIVGGSSGSTATTSTAGSINTWVHCFAEFIASDSGAALINGGSKGTGYTARVPASADCFYVGILPNGSSFPMRSTGGLCEISVWNAAGLSSAERDALAALLYNGGTSGGANPLNVNASGTYAGLLIAYWLDSNNTITDLAGNGHDLSTVGTLSDFGDHPTIDAVTPNEITPGVLDDFDDTNGTDLNDRGLSWLGLDADVLEVQGGECAKQAGATYPVYHWQQVMPFDDGSVSIIIKAAGTGTNRYVGVRGRLTTNVLATRAGYGATVEFDFSAGQERISLVQLDSGGGASILGSILESLTFPCTLTLKMEGTTISAYINGELKVQVSGEDTYPSAGYIGLEAGSDTAGSDMRFDDFTYANIETTTQSPTRAGKYCTVTTHDVVPA